MVEFSKETAQTIKESWEKNNVSPDFGRVAGEILDELTGEAELKAEPKYSKFMGGSINMSKDKITCCDIKSVKGTAIWDKKHIVDDKEEIATMFKIDGRKGLYCFFVPNPKAGNENVHDWCMATFVDIAAALVVKRGV